MKRLLILSLLLCSLTYANEKIKILLVGDSTTIGGIPRALNPDHPQLEGLIEILAKAEGLPALEVINSGQGGETAKRLLGSKIYKERIESVEDVDYLIVRMGINDWFKYDDFPTDFPLHMKALLAQLRHDHPEAKIILATICRFMSHQDCTKVNDEIKKLAVEQELPLLDIYTPYNQYLTDNGPHALNIRSIALRLIPAEHHAFLKPHTKFRKGWAGRPDEDFVRLNDSSLDPLFGHIKEWQGDRHPNTEGYNLIAHETVKFLKPILVK